MSGAEVPPSAGSGAPANENALAAGTRLAEFEILGVVGVGGFAIVYRARDTSLHRTVAIKEYLPSALAYRKDDQTIAPRSMQHFDTFSAALRSFIQEARLLAQFEHPALVRVHRFWEANGTAYMAMPLYEGRTLRDILKADPGFAREATLKAVVAPLLDAVALLHEQHCFHRDISPDNVIIQANGLPVLLDFGAARRIIGDMTQALTVVLKPGYAPIEQYVEDGGLVQGPWTDVYGLAALLYVAIAGKPPPPAVARAYKDALVPLASQAPPGYSLEFLRGIDAGLAVRPEDRPASIAEFRRALGLGGDAGVAGPTGAAGVAGSAAGGLTPVPWTQTPVPEAAVSSLPPLRAATTDASSATAPAASPAVSAPAVPPPPAGTGSGGRAASAGMSTGKSAPGGNVAASASPPQQRARWLLPIVGVAVVAVAIVAGVSFYDGGAPRDPAKARSAGPDTTTTGTSSPTTAGTSSTPGSTATGSAGGATGDADATRLAQTGSAAAVAPVPRPSSTAPAAPGSGQAAAQIQGQVPAPIAGRGAPGSDAATGKAAKGAPSDQGSPSDKGPIAEKSTPAKTAAVEKANSSEKSAIVDKSKERDREKDKEKDKEREKSRPTEPPTPVLGPLSDEGRRYRADADRGDTNAQYQLAQLYLSGKGAPRSVPEALRWLRRAGNAGNVSAQLALAGMYASGQDVPKDEAEAAAWFRKAGDLGNATAQNALGNMYAAGQGVAKDDREAAAWYRKAAERGNVAAQTNLGLRYTTGQGVAKDDAEAVNWLRKAAEQGNARAQNNLGTMYANGQGVPVDEAEAARWFRKAADQGNAAAQTNLGSLYANGQGVKRDEIEAARWYRRAADQGYALAAERLNALERASRK